MNKNNNALDNSNSQTSCDNNCNSCTNNFNPILSGINMEHRGWLDKNRREITYEKGEIIFKENTFPSGLFCLSTGKVMTTKTDSFGNTIVTNLNKGVNFIGVADYLAGMPYQATCIALSQVKACIIDSKSVEELISKNNQFSRKLLTSVAKDYQQSCSRLLAITKKNMNSRIADALLELLNVFGLDNENCIDVYLKRSEIAHLCNMNETNVIRHLSALDKLGAIKLNAKKICILNKDLLFRESSGNY